MATTTKTLTPTGQTITLPDMTEKPNASVLVDGIGKDADAINALNSKISTVKLMEVTHGTINAGTASTIEVANVAKRPYIIGYAVSGSYNSDVIPWSYYYSGTTFVSRVKNTGANNASNIVVTYSYFEM